jgi:hypothetical protein
VLVLLLIIFTHESFCFLDNFILDFEV